MKEAYIGIPSLTEAQRAAELLRRERIGCTVTRMPALPGKGSCTFGLRSGESSLQILLTKLHSQGIHTGRVIIREANGVLWEWKP